MRELICSVTESSVGVSMLISRARTVPTARLTTGHSRQRAVDVGIRLRALHFQEPGSMIVTGGDEPLFCTLGEWARRAG
jgi:hypothetical protein